MTANRVYFVQHGLALSKAEDPERPLSDEGVQQTRNMARRLLASGITVSGVFHSGKLRAQQTAEILAAVLKIETAAEVDHLSPDDDISLIRQHLTDDDAMYVGHLPHLEKLVSSLVTGNESPAILKFQNSAAASLLKHRESGLFRLEWYLTPRLVSGE